MKLADYLGARPQADASWRFHVERTLHGAFGGAFGRAVCAAALVAAVGIEVRAGDALLAAGMPSASRG